MNSFSPAIGALYNPQSHQWHFSEQSGRGFDVSPITPSKLVVEPSLLALDPASVQRGQRQNRKRWSRCLVQDAPEMGSALPWVDNYFEESELIASNTHLADPHVGRLLAFGKAGNTISRERLYNVVAYARGPTGTDLGIAQLSNQRYEFAASQGVKLLVPRITDTTAPPAYQFHSPIQQICFAGHPWYNEWAKARLAVRTSGYTTVFRTHKTPYMENIQTARFIPQMIASVGTLDTDGNLHADVAFNPWYDRQFTIIDQSGTWKVWDIEGMQNSTMRKTRGLPVQASAFGQVTSKDAVGIGGWGRVVWGGDLNTLMACIRQRVALFDIRSTPSMSSAINLPVDRDRGLILDMQRGHSDGYGQDAFVLTSSHLAWIDIRQPGRPLLALPHGRHRGDISLSLELYKSNEVTTALIYSRMNSLITSYQFSVQGEKQYPALVEDPSITSLFCANDSSAATLCFGILPCRFRFEASHSGPASRYENGKESFFTTLSVDKKLGISQRLYSTEEEPVEFLKYNREKFTTKQVKSVEFIVDEDSEISETDNEENVLEGDDEDDENRESFQMEDKQMSSAGTADEHFGYLPGLYHLPSYPAQKRSHRRMNMEDVYGMAFSGPDESLRTATEQDLENTVQGFCGRMSRVLGRRVTVGNLGISSLLDAAQPFLLFEELQELEDGMKALLEKPEMQEAYDVRTLFSAEVAGFPIGNDVTPSINSLYETLVSNYVSPLPNSVPSRVRLRRERLCRLIATETYLSSIGVNIKPSPENIRPPAIEDDSMSTITPPPETPDQAQLYKEADKSEPLQRLRSYAHVQTRISLPPGMRKVLDTWKIGDNPWEVEFFVDPSEGVPRYRQDRRKLRKEREKRNSQLGVAASQPPVLLDTITVRGPQPGVAMSSQDAARSQSQGFGGVMSQVERGPHGGRKSKKRKTGF